MRLTKKMKETVAQQLVESIRGPREAALNRREAALAVKLMRHRYGDDVFDRARALPEGWLQHGKQIHLAYDLFDTLPNRRENPVVSPRSGTGWVSSQSLKLAEHVPLPYSASSGWDLKTVGPLIEDLHELFADRLALAEKLDLLRRQAIGVLESFTTVEKLADGWPEGYAYLPAEDPAGTPANLPAIRIKDLNERIEALRTAA